MKCLSGGVRRRVMTEVRGSDIYLSIKLEIVVDHEIRGCS
jgi:hypothetical protein